MLFRRKRRSEATSHDALAEVHASLQRWAAAQSRTAWRPVIGHGGARSSQSQFCGAALLLQDEPQPACKLCGRPLQLFLQLDLDALPTDEYGHGTLQLFYCVGQPPDQEPDGRPDCWAEGAWAPFSDEASLVRVVSTDSLVEPELTIGAAMPEAAIVGWESFIDAPDPEDHHRCGLVRRYDGGNVVLQCEFLKEDVTIAIGDLDAEEIARAAGQDKLGGWPSWIQGAEYPSCPKCQKLMRLVFQIDSEDHVPYMFGDCGIGHVTQCPDHYDVVAFGWACT